MANDILYDLTPWQDAPSTLTPINAENLNARDSLLKKVVDKTNQLQEQIVTQAKPDEDGIVSFKNSQGLVIFTLDLSEFSGGGNVYGELVLSAEELLISEGKTGAFTVKLTSAPTANQPVYLASSDSTKLSIEPSTLTFTPENWNVEQTVTVTTIMDNDGQDESITIALTSKKVSPKELIVSITDTYEVPELVTDGLAMYFNYRGHTEDTSTTITDEIHGVTAKNFDKFVKLENGIAGNGNSLYLTLNVNDENANAMVEQLKNGKGFTLETFGTVSFNDFLSGSVGAILGSGSSRGINNGAGPSVRACASPKRILQDGTSDSSQIQLDVKFTINGKQITFIGYGNGIPHYSDFLHVVYTFSENGEICVYINGYKEDNPTSIENFASWDIEGMFGTSTQSHLPSLFAGYNSKEPYYRSIHRIYDRVLTHDEIKNNMKFEAMQMGITNF